ncbi:MAG: lipopolysaccharide biosynthesis protein [Solirubrobacterales bacterium]
MQYSTLKRKTLSGLFWSFSGLIINQGAQFIIQVFLARLLFPADFGVIGMIAVFISVSQTLIDSGFASALIREKEPSQEDLSTVFYFNLIMSCAAYIILFFASNEISLFFRVPKLVPILRVVTIVFVINSFGIIQETMLTKNLNFKLQTKINILSSVISGAISIIMAFGGMGVWSLVGRTVFFQLIKTMLLCSFMRWSPSLVFNFETFKRFYNFGWKLMVSGLISSVYQNIYSIIIGRQFSPSQLGYYTNAQKLNDTACQSITVSVQKVSYPVLSSLRDDHDKLKHSYRKIIKSSVFITFPMLFGLAAAAQPLIMVIFGEKWINSILYFQIICFAGALYPLHAINLSILEVKGRSDLFLRLEIVKKFIAFAFIGTAIYLKLGILGLLWAGVINSYTVYFINSYYSAELLSYPAAAQIKDIASIYIAAVVMALIVYTVGYFLTVGFLLKLIIQIVVGIVLYVLLCRLLKINELNEAFDIIKYVFKKIKGYK